MIHPETLKLLKIIFSTLALVMLVVKTIRISLYNKQAEEPAALKILWPYSYRDIESCYSAATKKLMHTSNSITTLFYLCIALLALSFAVPTISRILGFS